MAINQEIDVEASRQPFAGRRRDLGGERRRVSAERADNQAVACGVRRQVNPVGFARYAWTGSLERGQ